MMKNDEEQEKKTAPSRGRIMQVVEVEEEDVSKEKIDEIVPTQEISHTPTKEPQESSKVVHPEYQENVYEEEKPDIGASFPMEEKEEHIAERETMRVDQGKRYEKEITPLKGEEKRDIVSELFDTKERAMSYPDISIDKKSSRFGFLIWVFVLLGIVGIIGAGLLFLKSRSASQTPVSAVLSPTSTPTPIETEAPTPATPSGKITPTSSKTASPSAKPKGLTIQVLNGSGKSGVASAMKKYLEEKGYTVVGTGNAKNFEYEKTEILIKSAKTSFLDKLKTDLAEKYVLGDTSTPLEESASYDAQVIIGKE